MTSIAGTSFKQANQGKSFRSPPVRTQLDCDALVSAPLTIRADTMRSFATRSGDTMYSVKAGLARKGTVVGFSVVSTADGQVCRPGLEDSQARFVTLAKPDAEGRKKRFVRVDEQETMPWNPQAKNFSVSVKMPESSETVKAMRSVEETLWEKVVSNPASFGLPNGCALHLKKTEVPVNARDRSAFVRFTVWGDCVVSLTEEEDTVDKSLKDFEENPLAARRGIEGMMWGVQEIVFTVDPAQSHSKRSKIKRLDMQVRWTLYKIYAGEMIPQVETEYADAVDMAKTVAAEVATQLQGVSFAMLKKMAATSAALLEDVDPSEEDSSDQESHADDEQPLSGSLAYHQRPKNLARKRTYAGERDLDQGTSAKKPRL